MKKLLLLFMLCLSFSTGMYAKTIHWLTFIDTTDRNVGEIDKSSRQLLYSRWIDLVNTTLKDNGYSVNIVDIYDSNTSPENCKKIVNSFNCGSEDIIVFYYIGHGTENTGASKYPLMLMGQLDANKFIPLSWVHDTLKNKGARLTVTIGMCCNARQGVAGRITPTFGANYGNTYVSEELSNCIKKMFLNYRGNVLITSASPNESSWACDTTIGPTDYFTFSLLDQFNNELPETSNPTWDSMMESIKEDVYNNVRNNVYIQDKFPGSTQTPIWETHLTSASTPTPTPPVKPKTENVSDKSEMLNTLSNALAYISSTKVSAKERIVMAEKLEKAFDNNAIVRIMSQDGNLVLHKENISIYLGRIATSRLLENVTVVDATGTTNKISSIRVREIYKKR